MAFIFDPKKVDPKRVKRVRVLYLFNQPTLYKRWSSQVPTLLIDREGRIAQENISTEEPLTFFEEENLLEMKIGAYKYVNKIKKKEMKRSRMGGPWVRGYGDLKENLKMIEMYDRRDRRTLLDQVIQDDIEEIIEIHELYDFYLKYLPQFKMLQNYITSLYYGLFYTISPNRNYRDLTDPFRYALFINIVLYYCFHRFDLEDGYLAEPYLKTVIRLFIEDVHKKDVIKRLETDLRLVQKGYDL
ncbi:MAG: hypothetical protein C6I05_01185 [Epsilonproteobacteria bacterium]|nr:hypothetical protein [Campylobacterota bacterium]